MIGILGMPGEVCAVFVRQIWLEDAHFAPIGTREKPRQPPFLHRVH
jgi:hypothetical protein